MNTNRPGVQGALRQSLLASGTVAVILLSTASANAETVSLNRCVLVSKSLEVAFIARPNGGLASLDIQSGTTRWTSTAGELPIGVTGDALLAQGEATTPGALKLVTLSAAEGRTIDRHSVSLPSDVHAAVSPGPGRSFAMSAAPVDGGFQLSWHAMRTTAARGLSAAEDGATPRAANGRVDIAIGSNGVPSEVAPTGGAVAVTPSIREVKDIDLGVGRLARKFASADGRHVMVSERKVGAAFLEAFEWSVYDFDSRRLVGKVTAPIPVAPFVVTGSTVLFSTPEMGFHNGTELEQRQEALHAKSLATGKALWSRELRSLMLKGPLPH